jgi:aryl-alcohol dehydrogenase-like predicted oxidoreductase
VLATKFRFTMGDGPNRSGASRYRIVKCCEDSLRRLKTDRIDLYQIPHAGHHVPEEETLRALDDLVSAGKVLYTGCSNYAAYRLMNSLWLSRTQHLGEVRHAAGAVQPDRARPRARAHPAVPRERASASCRGRRSPAASSPASSSAASRRRRARARAKPERFARYDTERNWKIIDAVRRSRARSGSTPAAVSIAWLLAKPQVTSVIFGARTIEQLEANLAARSSKLRAARRGARQGVAFELGYPYEFIKQTQATW